MFFRILPFFSNMISYNFIKSLGLCLVLFLIVSCKKNGYYEEKDAKNRIKYSAFYVDGKLHGELKEYDTLGHWKSIFTVENGLKNGGYTLLGTNYEIIEIGTFKNDSLDGQRIKYLGKWDIFSTYSNGELVDNLVYDNNLKCIVQKAYKGKIYNYDLENGCKLLSIAYYKKATKIGEVFFNNIGIYKIEGEINFLDKDDTVLINKYYPNF